MQWPVCLTCAWESQTIGSLHISMHTSVTRLTPHLYEHIRQSDHCTFACTHQVHVNVKWPVCLTCACKCAESQTIRSLHIFKQTLVIVPTAKLHEHIRQSAHCTFACTHQVHVNVKWPVCLTCACKCAESQTIGSLHIFMHTLVIVPNYMNTSDSRFTAHLQAHIRCMKMCSDPSDWRVHINVQRVRQLLTAHFHAHIGHWSHCPINEHISQSDNCTFPCTHQLHAKCSDTCVLRVHVNVQRVIHLAHCIFHAHFSHMAHSPFTGTHWTVTSVHVYMHTSGACKRAATGVSDVCM